MTKEYTIEEAKENYDNKDFMMNAIDEDASWVIAYASDRLHADKELMKKAVSKDGQMLYYADSDIRNNKDIVLTAVKQKWLIIKYASKQLRSDIDVAIAAVSQNKNAIIYLAGGIENDPKIQEIVSGDK